jgi:hypothetical protein
MFPVLLSKWDRQCEKSNKTREGKGKTDKFLVEKREICLFFLHYKKIIHENKTGTGIAHYSGKWRFRRKMKNIGG